MGSLSRNPRAYSFYIFIIFALGMLFISVYYIVEALLILQSGEGESAIYQLAIGVFGVGASSLIFLRFRKRMTLLRQALPPTIITIIECKKCGLKSLRNFVKGDFVFKSVNECKKCSEPMLITGIYAEKAKK
jgi:hypothetical protein